MACGAPITASQTLGPVDETIHRFLIEANVLRLRKDYEAALERCTLILHMAPGNAPAHSLLGDIYRDKGDFHEALGWYKLAVHLDGSNAADKKKLNDMIDRVFQGAERRHARGLIEEPEPPKVSFAEAFRGFILKVQPVHVALASAALMVSVVLCVLLLAGHSTPSHTTSASSGKATSGAPAMTPSLLPAPSATGAPFISPPQPDVIETGKNPNGAGAATQKPAGATQSRTGGTTKEQGTNSSTGPILPDKSSTPPSFTQQPKEIKPYSIGNDITEAAQESDVLRDQLQGFMEKSKLPGVTVRNATIEPSTVNVGDRQLTISYVVPAMKGPRETKQALVYAGFQLTWGAMNLTKDLPQFYLRGYAYGDAGTDPSLSFLANLTPEHAEQARQATDYESVLKYLDSPPPWWSKDLNTVPIQ